MFAQGYPLYAVRKSFPNVVYAVVGWEPGGTQLPALVLHVSNSDAPKAHGWITPSATEELTFSTDLDAMLSLANGGGFAVLA